MPDRDIIHKYLKSLSKYLSRLEKSDADDVIREIESHIYDALENNEKAGMEISAEAILAGFGQPRDLAAQYVEHMLTGAAPPKGFRAIQRVKKGATRSLYFATGFIGYSFSLFLISIGLYKPFEPDKVGVWVDESGNFLILGLVSSAPDGVYEMLGWWVIPVTIGLGLGGVYLTKRILGVLSRKI